MRRITVIVAALLLAMSMLSSSALAIQPPAPQAQHLFGCPDPVSGHPGAAGLVDATPQVVGLTGNPQPTAWNAVVRAEPIELGECD
ncbi:MAG: hypothetical protein EA387_07005 [Nitriliruptor sp.]|nr:MAG: hypothetical protein EA387_07005 [Nitriliruptor sp.]